MARLQLVALTENIPLNIEKCDRRHCLGFSWCNDGPSGRS